MIAGFVEVIQERAVVLVGVLVVMGVVGGIEISTYEICDNFLPIIELFP